IQREHPGCGRRAPAKLLTERHVEYAEGHAHTGLHAQVDAHHREDGPTVVLPVGHSRGILQSAIFPDLHYDTALVLRAAPAGPVALEDWGLGVATRIASSRRGGVLYLCPSWAMLQAYCTRATKKFPCSRWTNSKS